MICCLTLKLFDIYQTESEQDSDTFIPPQQIWLTGHLHTRTY